jgi:hypothetical protein
MDHKTKKYGGIRMKKLATILGIILLAGIVVYPAFAHMPGWGRAHAVGYWDTGPGGCRQINRSYGSLAREQRARELRRDHEHYGEYAPHGRMGSGFGPHMRAYGSDSGNGRMEDFSIIRQR